MIIHAFILSFIVGLLRRGKPGRLGRIPLRHTYLFILPFLLFAAVCTIAYRSDSRDLLPYVRMANIAQYVVLLTAIALNIRVYLMWLAGLGTFCNFLVVAANGGVMPVSAAALRTADLACMLNSEVTSKFMRHAIMDSGTRLVFLGDIIPVPGARIGVWLEGLLHRVNIEVSLKAAFSYLNEVGSIGDVILSVAIFLLIQRCMCARKDDRRPDEASSGGEARRVKASSSTP